MTVLSFRHCEKQAKPATKQSHSGIEIAASP
jgi:hypothetical protein